MRILYLIPGLGGGGGAEKSLAAMVPYWTKSMDIHIVTFSEREALRATVESHGARMTNLGPLDRGALVRSVQGIVHREHPQLIHTTLFEADLAGRAVSLLTGVPTSTSLVSVHYSRGHLNAPGARSLKRRVVWTADAASAHVTVRFHALTAHVAEVMARRLGVRRHRIDVIPRGRDPVVLGECTALRREQVRESLSVGDSPLVVAAARHEWPKGLDVLVGAAQHVIRELPRARVVIAGREGSQSARLRAEVERLGLADRVRFIGPRDDVSDLMCAADVWCVPSRWEGFGSILVELMALGTPTVASDTGAIREVAGSPPCFELVPPERPEELAAAILRVLDNPQLAAIRAERAQQRFLEHFTAERVSGEMIRFFQRSIDSSRWSQVRPRRYS